MKSTTGHNENTISDFILELLGIKNMTMSTILENPRPYNRQQIQKGLHYLKRKQFIAFPARVPKARIILTKLGVLRLNRRQFDKLAIVKTRWDGKWRLLTFDIPEDRGPIRDVFRRKLKQIGFFHFQRSVFVLPYQCSKEIALMIDYLEITSCVHLLTADRFPGDKQLVKKFQL